MPLHSKKSEQAKGSQGALASGDGVELDKPSDGEFQLSPWIKIGVPVVAVVGFFGLLSLGGITFLPPAPAGWPLKVTVLPDAAKGAVVTAAVTWAGGFGALVTYLYTYQQKENHARQERRQKEEIAGKEHVRIVQIEEERAKRERDLAELQRIEAEFAALSADFAKSDSLSQINAAIGMGDLARRPDPRRVKYGEDLPEIDEVHYEKIFTLAGDGDTILAHPRVWPTEWRTSKTERNYPFFLRAARRLASSLSEWPHEASRAQAAQVLREMGDFAKHENTDEPLLHALASLLSSATKASWANFKKNVNSIRSSKIFIKESLLCSLLLSRETTLPHDEMFKGELQNRQEALYVESIESIILGESCKGSLECERELTEGTERFHLLTRAAACYCDARDSLSYVLRKLSRPVDLRTEYSRVPKEDKESREESIRDCLRILSDRRGLVFDGIALINANLRSIQSQGANWNQASFFGSVLSGSNMTGTTAAYGDFRATACNHVDFTRAVVMFAYFQCANLRSANLHYTHLGSSIFREAHLDWIHAKCSWMTHCDFFQASLDSAVLSDTDLSYGLFKNANLVGASLVTCEARHCDFSGAIMWNVRLADTAISGSVFEDTEGSSIFRSGEEWTTANFRLPSDASSSGSDAVAGAFDIDLWNRLDSAFPTTPPRTPPWEQAPPESQEQSSPGEA